jgi:hypothetical protein
MLNRKTQNYNSKLKSKKNNFKPQKVLTFAM